MLKSFKRKSRGRDSRGQNLFRRESRGLLIAGAAIIGKGAKAEGILTFYYRPRRAENRFSGF